MPLTLSFHFLVRMAQTDTSLWIDFLTFRSQEQHFLEMYIQMVCPRSMDSIPEGEGPGVGVFAKVPPGRRIITKPIRAVVGLLCDPLGVPVPGPVFSWRVLG